jgi:hypothetical protein
VKPGENGTEGWRILRRFAQDDDAVKKTKAARQERISPFRGNDDCRAALFYFWFGRHPDPDVFGRGICQNGQLTNKVP